MLVPYEKDIVIVQNDDMPNSFEVSYKGFGVSYHLGYSNETDFDFFFSKTDYYKKLGSFVISISTNKMIKLLSKIKPNLSKNLNVIDDFNIYGEKKLTEKDKSIIRHIYTIAFFEQVNYLIEMNMQEYLESDIMDFYLHLLSFDIVSNILEESSFKRQELKNKLK